MTVKFRPGRLAPDPSKPRLKLAPFLDIAAAHVPVAADYVSAAAPYGMDGNDVYGDCVWAEIDHHVQAASTFGDGVRVTIPYADLLAGYSAVTGFDPHAGTPGNNPTDQGTVMQDAQNYWRKHGVGGHKTLAFAEVDIHNLDHVRAAIATFGGLSVGINFPAVAMTQFNQGKPWDVVAQDGGIEGGHAIHVGGYDIAKGTFLLTTWGRVHVMTEAFWRTYVEEAWTPILPEWVNDRSGLAPSGLDLAGLGVAFSELTGAANPFPAPAPAPVPPAPPGPGVDPADAALAGAVRVWAGRRHTGGNQAAAVAVKAWLTAKGL